MAQSQRGIQSVEIAGEILSVICSCDKPLSLSQIAEYLNIAPGSAHIYLVSLVRTGLLKRNEITLEYEPGSLVLRLGITHFDNSPLLTKAKELLSEYATKFNVNVFLTLWSVDGPTVIFYKENAGFLNISFKLGITLSLLETTTGQLFCAFKDPIEIKDILTRKNQHVETFKSAEFQNILANIRTNNLVVAQNLPTSGITTISVPVLDQNSNIIMALSVFNETHKLNPQLIDRLTIDLHSISKNLG